VLAFLVLYVVSSTLMADLDNVWLGTLLEPLGSRALARTLRYWSSDQRNSGLPELAGYLLANRALWLAISGVLFAATFALFRTERTGTGRALWRRRKAAPVLSSPPALMPVQLPPRV